MSTREVTFSGKDNLSPVIEKIKGSANALGNELIREAQKNTSSQKDAIRHYEEQVRLIERKNKLHQQEESHRIKSQMSESRMSGDKQGVKDGQGQMSQLQSDAREDQIQIELLRELINTVKHTSSQEIRADDKNSIRNSTQRSQGAGFAAFAEEYSEDDDGFTPFEEVSSKGKGVGGRIANVAQTAQAAAGSGNIVQAGATAATGLMGANPVAMIAAAIIGLGLMGHQAIAKREVGLREYAGISGINSNALVNSEVGTTNRGQYGALDLNITREEFNSKYLPAAARSAGTASGASGRAMRHAEVERSMAVSHTTVTSLEKLTRVMQGVGSSQSLATKIYSSMYGTGALGRGNSDMSRMQDIMEGFTSFQEGQFMRAGVTDGSGTLGMMRRLQMMGGNFKRDDYAFDTIGRMNSGLSQAGGSEAQAIKFDILRRQNPNKSFFELQAEMEKGVNSKGYMSGVFDFVKGTGGDLNSQSILLDSLTGGSMRKSDILSMLKSGNMDGISDGVKSRGFDFKGRAIRSSSNSQMEMDFAKESLDDVMTELGKTVSDILETLKSMSGKFDQTMDKMQFWK